MPHALENKDREPGAGEAISRERHRELLRRQLTPAGAAFVDALDRAIGNACDAVNNSGSDAIRDAIAQHHLKTLDSVKTVNRIAEGGQDPYITSCYMMMNHACILLSSGQHHRSVGELTSTGCQLLAIWRIYANKLTDLGETTPGQIDAEEKKLLEAIGKTGRPKLLSLFGIIKSVLGRK